MPVVRALDFARSAALPGLRRALGWALRLAVVGIGLFALALLVLRFVVFPRIDAYRDTIVAALSRQLGEPVSIEALEPGWDGWNPRLVIHGFRMRDRAAPADAPPLLELPAIDATVAWTSLPFAELRFRNLTIERPRLAIRRDAKGVVHVAGLEIDPEAGGDDSPFTAWAMRQPQIVVRDALVTWTDERRQAPQLVLDRVQLRLESRFGRHRFGLRGTPPAELAAPLDVRGDLVAASLRDWQKAEGQLYVRLDYADAAAWREWLPLPLAIERGKGALRMWFTFAQGEAREIVADLELADVRTTLAEGLPPLELPKLVGRVGWRFDRPTRELFAHQLAFTTAQGASFEPANLTLVMRETQGKRPAHGELLFDRLQLAPLQTLAAHLPLPRNIRDDLARYRPRGTLTHGHAQWEGPADAPVTYSLATAFAQLGLEPDGAVPGLTGFTGSFKADQTKGSVQLATEHGTLTLPRVFADAVPVDSLQGDVDWERTAAGTSVRVSKLAFANAHAAGDATGTWRSRAQGPGEIDLDAKLVRGRVDALPRYLPLVLRDGVRRWLTRGITGGKLDDVKVKLKGDLAGFPFANGKGGTFLVTGHGTGVTLDFAERWPAFTGVDASLRFEGTRMLIEASDARMFGVHVAHATAEIPDLTAMHPPLAIAGEASGPTRDFLRFLAESPVHDWIGNVTTGAEATGDGRLALKLTLPLGDLGNHRVAGEYAFVNDDLRLPGVPPLQKVNGTLAFTEHDLKARELAAEALGGPARLAIGTADGHVRVTGSGTASLAAVRREFPLPVLERTSGTADWTFAMDARPEGASWALESPLRGVAIDLPAPLHKAAADTLPLRLERRAATGAPSGDTLVATLGKVGTLAAHRRAAGANFDVDRLQITFGRGAQTPAAQRAERPGIWVRAEAPTLDVDAWLDVQRAASATTDSNAANGMQQLEFAGLDLEAGTLQVFDRRFADLKVTGRRAQRDWRLELAGKEVAGQATWSAPGPGAANGRVQARLTRLSMPAAVEGDEPANAGADQRETRAWPELDITADSFANAGREYGRLELKAQPREAEWRIERLVLANDAARLEAEGAWRTRGRPRQTRLDLTLDIRDSGGLLARFGHPGAIQGAAGKVTGQLAWAGAPTDFDYPTLAGSFRLDVGAGRFMKIEPGIGKLLGVLSLQALPRRITLDFRDVFSEGFTFDRVNGDVRIDNGVMTTDNLRMVGPSAQVAIAGDANLASETQRLRVRVQPTLSAGVSAGAALFFLANPVVGAAVGAGSLLAQKVLRDPIEQIFSYEYSVTGSWSDPVVARTRAAQKTTPTSAANPAATATQ